MVPSLWHPGAAAQQPTSDGDPSWAAPVQSSTHLAAVLAVVAALPAYHAMRAEDDDDDDDADKKMEEEEDDASVKKMEEEEDDASIKKTEEEEDDASTKKMEEEEDDASMGSPFLAPRQPPATPDASSHPSRAARFMPPDASPSAAVASATSPTVADPMASLPHVIITHSRAPDAGASSQPQETSPSPEVSGGRREDSPRPAGLRLGGHRGGREGPLPSLVSAPYFERERATAASQTDDGARVGGCAGGVVSVDVRVHLECLAALGRFGPL